MTRCIPASAAASSSAPVRAKKLKPRERAAKNSRAARNNERGSPAKGTAAFTITGKSLRAA
jgi:hypothetical protein